MSMIQTAYCKILLHRAANALRLRTAPYALALMASTVAFAQSDEHEWPKTFNGQPDFDYSRNEVLDEMQEELSLAGEAGQIATIHKLIQQRIIDPLNFGGVALTSEEEFSIGQADAPNNLELPQIGKTTTEAVINIDEFRQFIKKVLSQKQDIDRDVLKRYDFAPYLDKVAIQTIATSPQKYVILNNDRYRVGDRFLLPVEVNTGEDELKKRINAYMPPEHLIDKEAFAQFETVRDNALDQFKQAQEAAAKKGQNIQNVSVTIKDIQHRTISVSIFGKPYTLKLKFRM